ncbi:MAG: hypothetical protein RIS09_665 [Actinomycetota bacterium]|jgi:hypothetical protein
MEIPPHLYERYGIKQRRFPWGIALGFSIIALVLGYALLVGQQVSIRLISWQTTVNTVSIAWRYEGEVSSATWCLLEAQDENRFDIGFALIELSPTDTNVTLTHTLTTTETAFAVLTPVCSDDLDRLPGSFFKPGVLPPAQLPPLFAPWQLP